MGSRCSRWCRCYWKPCCPPCSWSLHCCPCQHCGQHCSCLQHPPRHRHSCCPSCSWSFLCLPQRVLQRVPQRVLWSQPWSVPLHRFPCWSYPRCTHCHWSYPRCTVCPCWSLLSCCPSCGCFLCLPNVYSNMYSNVYSGLNHVYGKREAEAEPEANHHFYSNLYHPYTTYTGVRNVVPAVHAGVYNYNYPVHGVYYG